MLNETFYLDGSDARSIGIQLQSPIKFSGAIPVVESFTVPGRNGDIIVETGSYKNRKGSASCFCLQNNVQEAIDSAGHFLMYSKGYRRLETSNDPYHYWMARVENTPQIEQRMRTLAPFEISFDCKPQRFLKSGEIPVAFTEGNGSSITNPYKYTALPFITVYGSGSGRLIIRNVSVTINSFDGLLWIDCDTQNAYDENGNQNTSIMAPIFPTLPYGTSSVSFTGGISHVEIIPRWWEL